MDAEDHIIPSKGITTFAEGLGAIVALYAPLGGDLYYVDLDGKIFRQSPKVIELISHLL